MSVNLTTYQHYAKALFNEAKAESVRTNNTSVQIIDGNGYDFNQPLPLSFPSVRERFINSRFNFWVPSEISMLEDYGQYQSNIITEAERWLVKSNISYLTVGDNLIPDNVVGTILQRVTNNEIKQYYRWVIAEEANHVESYLFILESLGINSQEQGHIFNIYSELKPVISKINWNVYYSKQVDLSLEINDPTLRVQYIKNLVAYYIFEALFFPLGFAQIFALANSGKMRNMSQQYSYILRDETNHAEHALFMINQLMYGDNLIKSDVPTLKRWMAKALATAIEIEQSGVDVIFPDGGIEGISSSQYSSYIKYLGQRVGSSLGLAYTNQLTHPIPWVEKFKVSRETNFFEGRVVEYKKGDRLVFS